MQLSFNIDIQLIQNNLAPVVQKLDSAIQWLNHYPTDEWLSSYPVSSSLWVLSFAFKQRIAIFWSWFWYCASVITKVFFLSSELATDLSSPDIEGIYESQVGKQLALLEKSPTLKNLTQSNSCLLKFCF